MKTNPAARLIKKLWMVALWVGLGFVVGLAIPVSQTLAAHLGQIGAPQTERPSAPDVDLGALVRAVH